MVWKKVTSGKILPALGFGVLVFLGCADRRMPDGQQARQLSAQSLRDFQQVMFQQAEVEDLKTAREKHGPTKLVRRGPAPDTPGTNCAQAPLLNSRKAKLVSYVSGKLVLKAWISGNPVAGKRHPAVVYIHGNHCLESVEWLFAEAFVQAGFVIMMPMLRGENGNPGVYETYWGEVNDAIAAGKFVAGLPHVDVDQVFIAGHSTGAIVTVLAAMMNPSPYRAAASFVGYLDMQQYDFSPKVYIRNDPDETRLRNPFSFAQSLSVPLALFTDRSYRGHSKTFCQKALAFNKSCQIFTVSGDHNSMVAPASHLAAEWFRQISASNGKSQG